MSLPRLVSLVAFLLMGGLVVAPAAMAQSESGPGRTVRVDGEGTVSVAPDQATVRFGIVTQAEDPEPARAQNAEAAKRAMNTVREIGIPESKMQMETLRLQPRRERDPKTREWEEKGYEATRRVVVTVDSLDWVPRLVAEVVQGGANRLEGVRYDLRDRTAARNDALRQAARNAREKAELLAEALDAHLGEVSEIDEQNFSFRGPSPRVQMETAARQADAAPEPEAYAVGEVEVEARVQVVFALRTAE